MRLKYSLNKNVIGKSEAGHRDAAYGWKEEESDLPTLINYVTRDGYALCPALLTHQGRSKDHLAGLSLLVIDVDNKHTQDQTTWEDAKANPFLKGHALAMWTTANHKRVDPEQGYYGQDRYRVAFRLANEFTIRPAGSKEGYKNAADLLKRLVQLIPGADLSTTPIHYYAGTIGADFHVFNEANVLDVDDIKPEEPPQVSLTQVVDTSDNTGFNGSTEDSIANVKKFLEYIDSSSMQTWLEVAGCLKNIGQQIGDEVAEDLFLQWCPKDYPEWHDDPVRHERDSIRMFARLEPGVGGFGHLKTLAIDNGYAPVVQVEFDGFEPTEGYKVPVQSAVDEPPNPGEISLAVCKYQDEPKARMIRLIVEELFGQTNKIRLNELTNEIEVLGEPINPGDFEDAHHYLDKILGVLVSAEQARSALRSVANENRYHPVKDYLQFVGKTAPDVDLDLVATRVLGVNDDLSTTLVKKWLVGSVSKVLNAKGSSFIEVLTLISPKQGIGKSEFFKSLASPEWFSDSFAATSNEKDQILQLHSVWINEISEVDQFAANKRDFKQMKGLISSTSDQIRRPYGRLTETLPRRFALGATANEPELYGSDDEQRRFWTINVHPSTSCGRLDIGWLRDNRDAIWGTAVRLYQQQGDDAFKLTKDERASLVKHNQSEFSKVSSYHDELAHYLKSCDIQFIDVNQIYSLLFIDKVTPSNRLEIAGILKSEGYERKRNVERKGKRYSTCWYNGERSVDVIGQVIKGNFSIADF